MRLLTVSAGPTVSDFKNKTNFETFLFQARIV
jgi:hypothetical protein